MPVSENNSAGRLYNLLQRAITSGNRNRNASLVTVWQQALGCTSESETITAYLGIIELPDSVVRDWENTGLPNSALWFMPKVKAGIVRYNFTENWQYIVNHFPKELMQTLRGCTDTLEKSAPERTMPHDKVGQFLITATELFNEVQSADLELDLKHFLLEQIHSIEVALRQHRIAGVAPVEKALNQVIGSTIIKKSFWERAAKSPITRRIITFVNQVVIIVASNVVTTSIEQPLKPAQQNIIIFQDAARFWQNYERTIVIEENDDVVEIEEQKALPRSHLKNE